jgi:hypothetical protein
MFQCRCWVTHQVKATLLAVEAVRTIKRGDIFKPPTNAGVEVRLLNDLFDIAA